ncbi:MAG: ribulose-phosphate 3-epimerase, partial [Oscillospiraceae bacterium]|nr:ribulose-phosphate 3-epimerase [Oscillospiraceae bacterium]
SFMADMMPKVKALREIIEKEDLAVNIQVDGGIDKNTIKTAADAGANIFVAGSALFKQEDYNKAVAELRSAAD